MRCRAYLAQCLACRKCLGRFMLILTFEPSCLWLMSGSGSFLGKPVNDCSFKLVRFLACTCKSVGMKVDGIIVILSLSQPPLLP